MGEEGTNGRGREGEEGGEEERIGMRACVKTISRPWLRLGLSHSRVLTLYIRFPVFYHHCTPLDCAIDLAGARLSMGL